MPVFGGRSERNLLTVHPQLVHVLRVAILTCDFMVIQSDRSEVEQEADFKKGVTHAHWGESPHDFNPSFAVDCAPLPLDWNNTNSFATMASHIKDAAKSIGVEVTWGGDWHTIKDHPHIELTNWRKLAKHIVNLDHIVS
jgi:peptidoglycan L-alanyl-D-glutamate endopeptidase CwlK